MSCDGLTCVCHENGEFVAECDSMNLCLEIDPFDPLGSEQIVDPFVEDCCGWADFGEPMTPGG